MRSFANNMSSCAIMINFKVCAVLPAGGSGERADVNPPKQFCLIDGKPLLCYTVEAFERVPWISRIVLVVAAAELESTKDAISTYGFQKTTTTVGGSTRHRSIAAGIEDLQTDNPEVVIIHDAVRPLVPIHTLTEVVLAAKKYGASGATRPLSSTVVAVDGDGFLAQSLDRSKYVASEMPQAFNYSVIAGAYSKCSVHDYTYGTECLQLALKYSEVRAKLIEGPAELWKVTYKKDLYALDRILRGNNTSAKLCVDGELDDHIKENFIQLLSNKVKLIDGNQLLGSGDHDTAPVEVILHIFQPLLQVENWCSQRTNSIAYQRIIHIILPADSEKNCQEAFTRMRRLAQKMRECKLLLYFIWRLGKSWDDKCIGELADLIVMVLLERHSSLAGQFFTMS